MMIYCAASQIAMIREHTSSSWSSLHAILAASRRVKKGRKEEKEDRRAAIKRPLLALGLFDTIQAVTVQRSHLNFS
eukprot:scaffold9652_cov103-Skeletonema_dohrnii-CCMP3373.AAC.2